MTLREWIERYQQKLVFERVPYRGVAAWKNVLAPGGFLKRVRPAA
jgi:hypothetical protein